MGSWLRRFIGISTVMYTLVISCLVCLAAGLPIEDTPEVKAAKEEFTAAFKAAETGEHAALAPVNTDTQAPAIEPAYLNDEEAVAEAKAAFLVTFADVEAGGLAALQAPAPEHIITALAEAPAAPVVYPLRDARPAGLTALPYSYYPYHAPYTYSFALPHYGLPAFNLYNLPYAGLPILSPAEDSSLE